MLRKLLRLLYSKIEIKTKEILHNSEKRNKASKFLKQNVVPTLKHKINELNH